MSDYTARRLVKQAQRIATLERQCDDADRERMEAEAKAKRLERALHAIINEAHPKHMTIFTIAMDALGLKKPVDKLTPT